VNPAPSDIKTLREFIKNELSGLYPVREIESMSRILFEELTQIPRSQLNLDPSRTIDTEQVQQVREAVDQIRRHKPIQYVLGYADFYGMRFRVTPAVLIPRPETEELVQWVVEDNRDRQVRILDVGTGSGCIAVALKKSLPGATVFATDISLKALEIAAANAELNQAEIHFLRHDVGSPYIENVMGELDIMVSNPPYIPFSEKESMHPNVTGFEPPEALFVPDRHLLKFYSLIAQAGHQFLVDGGRLYFEIHEKFGARVVSLLRDHGYGKITLRQDINGKDRMINCLRH
jgi:release factor glutamine methyltransferase